MPVCSIVKLLPLGTVDDLMHYCTRPSASCNSASGRPWHLGVIVYSYFMPVCSIVYKYNIPERVIVENIIPRNVIINRCAAEVDNHISRDDIFDYHPIKNVIFILLYRTLFIIFYYPFPSSHGAGSSNDSTMHICYEWIK